MKPKITRFRLFWGLMFLLLAVLLILDASGVLAPLFARIGGISFFQMIGGVFLTACGIHMILKHEAYLSLIWILTALFLLFEKNIAFLCHAPDSNLISNWIVLLAALFLNIGILLLVPSSRNIVSDVRKSFSVGENCGTTTEYIDCGQYQEFQKTYRNNYGTKNIYFTNSEQYQNKGTLHLENQYGMVNLFLPNGWKVLLLNPTNLFGKLSADDGLMISDRAEAGDAPVLTLTLNNLYGTLHLTQTGAGEN